MKRILVISWFYPPINSSEGLVTFKLLNHSTYEYDVFTQRNMDSWSYGKTVAFENGANVRSIYAKSKTLDAWKEEAYQYFVAHRAEYDCVMTRAMPPESHEVGLRIKQNFPEVKWIASFGDPIKDNPYQHIDRSLHAYHSMDNKINRDKNWHYRFSPSRIVYSGVWQLRHRGAIRLRRELAQIEDETMRLADRIVLNNLSQMRYMVQDEETQAKVRVIRHSYDECFYPEKRDDESPRRRKKLRFVFLGHLDAIRTAYPLLQAICNLKKERKDLSKRAEFLFYGEMTDSDLAFLVKNELLDVVKFCKPVPYLKSLEVMQDADWVVHIDGNIGLVSDENIFFAAKIADYFGSGSDILAITMPRGDAADALREANALVLSFSANEIKQYLYMIIYEGLRARPNHAAVQAYSANNVAAAFDKTVIGELYET